MAYDEDLANRIREQLAEESAITEKPMFGGLAFMLGGHLAVGASRTGGLLVRVGPERMEEALKRGHVRPMESGGRPMNGWVIVAPEGVRNSRQLASWVRLGAEQARSKPPKGAPSGRRRGRTQPPAAA